MSSAHERSISGPERPRRLARITAAAGLAAALIASGAVPAFAASTGRAPGNTPATTADKLGAADAGLLATARADHEKTVTMMVATAPGATEQVSGQLHKVKGALVGKTYDALGYVRATVPTSEAAAAISAASRLPSVHGIDLKKEIKLDDPAPETGGGTAATVSGGKNGVALRPAPDAHTPAKNPYNPNGETGAADFVRQHPGADGRGVTIGILDSGVDLGHPALRTTTTGERKIVDWVTATDPVTDGDNTWRRMNTPVAGRVFTADGRTWKAPAGSYAFNTFAESATIGGDMNGDLNRDGDTTDTWGVLYDPAKGTVRVDLDNDGDFTDDTAMKPYKDGFQIGYFGKDDPRTAIAERIPFVVEIRKDVTYDAAGDTSDYVNIGVVEAEHGTHVAGITAANGLFGGKMDGAAPGAKLVSSRACTWSGGCTNIALTEGMIDLVANRGVDIVNLSIGGLPPLNDSNNARDELYTRLIDTYGVQLVISAGNDGPGTNTISDPATADKAISVGASVSKDTWAADYGSGVTRKNQMMPFSARGPREDGGLTPTVTAPGAAINSIPTWEAGAPVAEAGYSLPPGYAMLQGTSMAAPQTTGVGALLLSAARQKHITLTPDRLRTALTSSAKGIDGVAAHEQGAGLIDAAGAWKTIERGVDAHAYTVEAPVDTVLSGALATPGRGPGVYDREGGLTVGGSRTYDVTVTRTTGPKGALEHRLSWKYDDGTFTLAGGERVRLPLNQPVTLTVRAKPRTAGAHSALLQVDDRATGGVDKQIMVTVVVAKAFPKPSYAFTASGTAQRNSTTSYFVTVPQGAKTLEVSMDGLAKGSQTRFITIHPYGVPVDDSTTGFCYPNYPNPANPCRPDVRSYDAPLPGVWEIEVEARRTSPLLDNPYRLHATVLGAAFDPAVITLPEAKAGTPEPVEWTVKNDFAPVEGKLAGGPLGSAKTDRPTIAQGEQRTTTVDVPQGAERLDVAIGNPADPGADLDLTVLKDGVTVAQSADGDSDESVSIPDPAPGTYTILVDGFAVPAGSTAYDYRDVYYSSALGSTTVDATQHVRLGNGASATLGASVEVAAPAPAGRQFFGEVRLLNANGTPAGTGNVTIAHVTP
ncbi:S8 family serine peptidase [Streptomyces sp. NBC_01497]|nr:S8 family serine peptidase [Streptomyces sp. NBC_01497]